MLARDFLRGVASTCVSGRLWTFHLLHQYLYAVSEGHMCVYDSYSLRDNSLFACVMDTLHERLDPWLGGYMCDSLLQLRTISGIGLWVGLAVIFSGSCLNVTKMFWDTLA